MARARPIYLDHHSTTPCDPRVVEAMLPWFTERFGNAASKSHVYGWEAETAVTEARERVSRLIGCADALSIVFTSGATEADNLAIKGVAELHHPRGKHLVTSVIEHKAVLDSMSHLERAGFAVTRVPVDGRGLVDPRDVERAIRNDTILVSIMLANNEIGMLEPVGEIGRVTRERGVLFHVDAAQAPALLDVGAMNVDLASISAHKMYGPKGVGALYVRREKPRARLIAQTDGGGHERAQRSGTLDVPGIVGFGRAAELLRESWPEESVRIATLRDRLRDRITTTLDGVTLNGALTPRLPSNLNLSFEGVDAESLMVAMTELAVSSGAACSSATLEPSYVLRALGLDAKLAMASIRFGLGRWNTADEIERAAEIVVRRVKDLRRACAPTAIAQD